MAFGAISTLYFPVAANAGSSLWGSDVRKLIASADAGNDASCKFAMSTNTAAHTVTADPYTSQASDLAEANYGWAIDPADMNSVAGALRYMPAGDHVATLRIQSTSNTNPTGSLTMFAYRVGNAAGGRTRTLLGSATISGQTFDTTTRTYTITLTLPEIVFAADETIQYSFELNGQGIAVTGKNNSFYTGTILGTPASMVFPLLGTILEGTGSAAGTGTVSGAAATVLPTTGDAAGAATVDGQAATILQGVGASAGAATVDGQGGATAGGQGSAAGVAAVDGVGGSATAVGGQGSAAGTSDADGIGGSTAAGTGEADGVATVEGQAAAAAAGSGTADGTSDVEGIGGTVAASTGAADAEADVDGVGGSVASGTGAAAGTATVEGEGVAAGFRPTTGTSEGSSEVEGIGQAVTVASTTGEAEGSATVTGIGEAGTASGRKHHRITAVENPSRRHTLTAAGRKYTISDESRTVELKEV